MADGNLNLKQGLNLAPQSSDPSNPAEGDIFCSDGTSRAAGYWQYINSAWTEFGGGGSGGINYLEGDNNTAENGVGDWATYADAAAVNPVDGTGGAATLTFTQNSTTPLRGDADFKFAKDAADRQGEGAGVAFTIDKADKAQKLTISFDYDASDANYADDDIRISVYDVTNANLIRINGEDLKGGQGTHYAQFQAAADSTSYRLIIHQSSTNATAYNVYLDNVKVGPGPQSGVNQEVVVRGAGNAGAAITGGTEAVDFSLVEDTTGSWSQVGAHGLDTFTAPETGYYIINGCALLTASVAQSVFTYIDGTQSKRIGYNGATTTIHPFSATEYLVKGEALTIRFGATATLSNDLEDHNIHIQKLASPQTNLETATVACYYTSDNGQSLPGTTSTVVKMEDKIYDTHNAYDTSTGYFTVPISGYYSISGAIGFSAAISTSQSARILISTSNGGVYDRRPGTGASSFFGLTASFQTYLTKGQTIHVGQYCEAGTSLINSQTYNVIAIHRIK